MKLSSVLASIKDPGAEKTASVSEKTAAVASATSEKLKAALKEVTAGAVEPEKTAASNSPMADLTKVAGAVIEHDSALLQKEAKLYGEIVADSFMSRLSQYNDAATKLAAAAPAPIKVAGEVLHTDTFEKFAAENPQLVKDAAELGYEKTAAQLEKLGQAAYKKGYDEATVAVYKTACDSFIAGFADTAQLLQDLNK